MKSTINQIIKQFKKHKIIEKNAEITFPIVLQNGKNYFIKEAIQNEYISFSKGIFLYKNGFREIFVLVEIKK